MEKITRDVMGCSVVYLANVMGFPKKDSRSKSETLFFNVPWIYVASKSGAIAVFPGTDVIGGPAWDITSRPWFNAAFTGENKLVNDYKGHLITIPYLDVLARSPMLVRTYMQKFTVNGEQFVVCTDIHMRGDEDASGLTTSIKGLNDDFSVFFAGYLAPDEIYNSHYFIFFCSLFLLLLIRKLSATKTTRIVYKRTNKIYGIVSAKDAFSMQYNELRSKEKRFGVAARRFGAQLEFSDSEIQEFENAKTFEVEGKFYNCRGFELWDAYQICTYNWKFLRMLFEHSVPRYIGTIRIKYTNEILPLVDWLYFNQRVYSRAEEEYYQQHLSKLLQRNVDLSDGSFEFTGLLSELDNYLKAPSIPNGLKVVLDRTTLLSIKQGRAYVRLNNEQMKELYTKATIKAVMTSGYFEQLLASNQVSLLLEGRTISRIISFHDKDMELRLNPDTEKVFLGILESYDSTTSRSIKKIEIPIDNESELLPVYDFAILDNSVVIVAHNISSVTGIDFASGKTRDTSFHVEGYISWRKSDVQFYQDLFNDMLGKSKKLVGFKKVDHHQLLERHNAAEKESPQPIS